MCRSRTEAIIAAELVRATVTGTMRLRELVVGSAELFGEAD